MIFFKCGFYLNVASCNKTELMGNLAIRSYLLRKEDSKGAMDFYARKKLLWDGENMRITNLEEANQFVTRKYRKGWEV